MPLNLTQLCQDCLFGASCDIPRSSRENYHGARFCAPCGIICANEAARTSHFRSCAHRKKEAAAAAESASNTWMHCPVCNIQVAGPIPWQEHASSGRHARQAAAHGVAADDVHPTEPPTESFTQCKLCREAHPNRLWRHHLASKAHKRREEHAVLRSAYERAGQDKGGIVVSHADSGVDFGVVDLARANQGLEVTLSISASGPTKSTVSITSVNVSSQIGQRSSPFSVTVTPASIAHGKTLLLPIRFRHGQRGHFEGRVEIVFRRTGSSSFSIWRTVKAVVGEAADRERLKPIAKYVRRPRAPWHHNRPVVSGERPPALFATPWVKKLTQAPIPTELADMVKTKPAEAVIGYITQRYMGTGTLSKVNHSSLFRALLWVEEVRAVEDLHMYDLVDAQFIKEGSLYTLRVEGLSEKRPSVVVGDAIRVQEANVPGDHTHEGFVHTVRLQDIRISFHRSFNVTGKRFNVCFQLNRTPLRRQHQALCATTPADQRLLFPYQTQAGLARPLAVTELPLALFNDLISTNPAQLQAVKSITSLRPGMAPFIIFGPPGTGKTVTVVEAIRQILHCQPRATILACAPSNSAADIIAERLTMFTPAEMTRCNAASRDPASVPAALVPYTHYAGDHYALPSREQLMQYRLTVSTCGNASFAHNIGIRQGHYSHIIVDEAGQASEPEVLTAIKAMAGANTIVILAGDPKQLGPVIRSSIARELGLGKSYLERLIEMPLYSSPNGRGTSYIKLVKNYRSHEAILRYPNQQFYDDELEVCGQPATINKFIGSPQLVSPRFPIVFHAISGINEREASSPSYFNIDEASQVKVYIEALLGDARHPIRPEDIAVVTQYHAQVLKIRKLLRDTGIQKGVMVTSVENIQGQERPVIIMSTVRSSQELLAYDAKFTLGFISNPRRFNVAVTRAQALLIVVGDPSVLSIDPLWRGFMNYIYLHGGWRGAAPTWDVNAPVKLSGDYAEDIREAAAEEMNEFMERVQNGEDIEAEANVERHFVEMD